MEVAYELKWLRCKKDYETNEEPRPIHFEQAFLQTNDGIWSIHMIGVRPKDCSLLNSFMQSNQAAVYVELGAYDRREYTGVGRIMGVMVERRGFVQIVQYGPLLQTYIPYDDVMDETCHMIMCYERNCSPCQRRISTKVLDYGVRTIRNFNEVISTSVTCPVFPQTCEECGNKEYPKYATIYDITTGEQRLYQRNLLGGENTWAVSDMEPGGELDDDTKSYLQSLSQVRSREEHKELSQEHTKIHELFQEEQDTFWHRFGQEALNDWRKFLSELNPEEMKAGCKALGISILSEDASRAAWRKHAQAHLKKDRDRVQFWKAANTEAVKMNFLSYHPHEWNVSRLNQNLGKERTRYLVLHFPLPKELEKHRNHAVGKVIKRNKESDIILNRIHELTVELDNQRRKAIKLTELLYDERGEKARLEQKIHDLKRELEQKANGSPVTSFRDPEDIQKIRNLKGLIRDLRSAYDTLRNQQKEFAERIPDEEKVDTHEFSQITQETISDWSQLKGKNVVVIGKQDQTREVEEVRVAFHEGSNVDKTLISLARKSDLIVLLTRLVSHQVMWGMKEFAAKHNKAIHYSRETNLERIFNQTADRLVPRK